MRRSRNPEGGVAHRLFGRLAKIAARSRLDRASIRSVCPELVEGPLFLQNEKKGLRQAQPERKMVLIQRALLYGAEMVNFAIFDRQLSNERLMPFR